MKDHKARVLAFLAIVLGAGAYALGGATASPTTEPDAAALEQRVAQLEQTTAALIESANVQATSIDDLNDGQANTNCLAYSDYHAFRETIGPHGRKYWSFPIMMWNMADPNCRPNPHKVWHPRKRGHG